MMNRRNFYQFWIDDLAHAQGDIPELAFDGAGPNHLAAALEEALRYSGLFEHWQRLQDDPQPLDARLGQVDAHAEVKVRVVGAGAELDVHTVLSVQAVRQRLQVLIGSNWELKDIRAV